MWSANFIKVEVYIEKWQLASQRVLFLLWVSFIVCSSVLGQCSSFCCCHNEIENVNPETKATKIQLSQWSPPTWFHSSISILQKSRSRPKAHGQIFAHDCTGRFTFLNRTLKIHSKDQFRALFCSAAGKKRWLLFLYSSLEHLWCLQCTSTNSSWCFIDLLTFWLIIFRVLSLFDLASVKVARKTPG